MLIIENVYLSQVCLHFIFYVILNILKQKKHFTWPKSSKLHGVVAENEVPYEFPDELHVYNSECYH